jgi:hypothetical protein
MMPCRNAGRSPAALIAIGQREEARSVCWPIRYNRIVDDLINYLGDKPEVQELIAGQTTGLAGEVSLSARAHGQRRQFLEGIVRAVMRKTPRAELPPPSTEICQSAVKVPGTPGGEGSVHEQSACERPSFSTGVLSDEPAACRVAMPGLPAAQWRSSLTLRSLQGDQRVVIGAMSSLLIPQHPAFHPVGQ